MTLKILIYNVLCLNETKGMDVNMKNFIITKLKNSSYRNAIQNLAGEVIYCELRYQRDRSSFVGMALKVINKKMPL